MVRSEESGPLELALSLLELQAEAAVSNEATEGDHVLYETRASLRRETAANLQSYLP